MKENAIEWITGENKATITISQTKYINQVLKLKEKDSESVEIVKMPEDNDGYLFGYIDVNRVRIAPKRKLSDEARTRQAEQLKRVRESKNAVYNREEKKDD